MAEQARITFAASAIKDLEDMQAYYFGEGVPDVGKRLAPEIVSKIERLGAHPLSGRVVPEFNGASGRASSRTLGCSGINCDKDR